MLGQDKKKDLVFRSTSAFTKLENFFKSQKWQTMQKIINKKKNKHIGNKPAR